MRNPAARTTTLRSWPSWRDEWTPDVAVAAAAQVSLRAPGAGTIDSAPGSAFGLALMQTGTSFVFAAVDDGLNVLDIWNGQN